MTNNFPCKGVFTWVWVATFHPAPTTRAFRIRAVVRMIFAWILEFRCRLHDPQLHVNDISSCIAVYRQADTSSS